MIRPALFAALCTNAKIHYHLDALEERHRDLLFAIERRELLATPTQTQKLEELKKELLNIRFVTNPLP